LEALNIHIGPLDFDHANYDADGDVLYLHVGAPQAGEGEEMPEGHVLRFAPGSQRIIGLTIINAQHLLDRDGRLIVTGPETVEASADDLARPFTPPNIPPQPSSPRGAGGWRQALRGSPLEGSGALVPVSRRSPRAGSIGTAGQ
jgi:uncharacterized protein YuzE